ncbi:MAG: right-handed parallel beta-helix repeat-containing protein [bacterium]
MILRIRKNIGVGGTRPCISIYLNFCTCLILSLIFCTTLLTPTQVNADTDVPSVISENTVWNKEGSPYRVSGFVTVRSGVALSIEPGTSVVFANNAHLQIQQGTLSILGTETEPVVFTGSATSSSWALDVIGPLSNTATSSAKSFFASHVRMENAFQGLYLQSADGVMSNAVFVGGQDGIYLSSSTLTLSDSKLSGMANSAISIDERSTLSMASTSITDLARSGISAYSGSHLELHNVHMERLGRMAAVGVYHSRANIADSSFSGGPTSAASAIEVYGDSNRGESQVAVHNSAIVGFTNTAIYNGGHVSLSAERNWWGNKAGPHATLYGSSRDQSAVYGDVSATPWLLRPPGEHGDSSTLFIPGIQATRLLKGDNQLWEPNRNADVETLYLDSAGKDLVSGIRTGSIIDSVNSAGVGPNVYKSLTQLLDSFVVQKKMREWQPLPYDWRFGAITAASDEAIETLERMASSSFTGKVNIVAHSNGGLVARHLLNRLADRQLDIVDKVIFVATPQLGTPQAIAAVLHGDGLQFAAGLVLRQSVGRRLAQYSPGALGLLPTQEYFETIASSSTPIIRFASTTDLISMNFFQSYGDHLDSATRLADFLSATFDRRSPPELGNVDIPAVVDRSLLESSVPVFGTQYPPADVSVIAGWGLDTLSGIAYSAKQSCSPPASASLKKSMFSLCNLRTTLRHDPVWSRLGDKTVMLASALGTPASFSPLSDQTYFVDLSTYNAGRFRTSRNHADILEVPQVRSLLSSLLHTPQQSDEVASSALPEYVSRTSPISLPTTSPGSALPRQVRLSVHSPVTVDLYDEEGNHTGLIGDIASSTSAVATTSTMATTSSPFLAYEESVPGSQYAHFGEAKYLSFIEPAPLSTGFLATTPRLIQIRSTGAGLLTLDVEYLEGDMLLQKASFSDIPVTPFTNISAEVALPLERFETLANAFFIQSSAATSSATTTLRQLVPDQVFDPVDYLSSVRQVIREICMSQRLRLELLARLNHYLVLLENGELPIVDTLLKEMVIVSDSSGSTDVADHASLTLATPEERGAYISAVEAMLSRISTLSGGR